MKINNTFGLLLGLLVFFTIGCQQIQNQMKADPDDTTVSVSVDDDIPDIEPSVGKVFIGDADGRFGTDKYTLNSTTINGNTLAINVSYGGGCEKHEMTLVVSESFLESFPVQLHVSLAHNANGDTCEAWLTENHNFDLTPIKTMYQKAYQQEAGTIILRLKDAPDEELIYEFTM
ncbi:MAG: hypothetical protein OXU23_01220 [Candidatus Poribacteria bacterium]|nr:hypothetical protein [Candidatus Poribacteria bacterium]